MGIADQQTGGMPSYEDPHHDTSQAKPRPQKRKADQPPSGSKAQADGKAVIDLTEDSPPKKRKKRAPDEEKRLRRWRKHAPLSYQEIRDRALTQRMFVLDRRRDDTHPDHPVETISLAGTTGNVYLITVDKVPSCDCPHAKKGNQCKHILYVLARVLRAPADLEYQLAFVSSELRDIFAKAPPLPSEQADGAQKDGKRKPLEGECPICCEDFEPENTSEETVYCKAACFNNIHKACFEQWAATKKNGAVTCPFCRTPWQGDEDTLKKVAKTGKVNEDGYVNVASQLGISGTRDYSTYHPHWVQRQFGYDYS
ncbi:hypothetical protein LTR37_008243 [Vermiconidia calcicola]|uniref:Uncharacterized protein n=1 Tax=Vermiconidia calcicola TaxID=1690605 RepID=A0ACC3NB40_9PEZI|nr:hypothetical protein LTR37_008243 [Vermiconidia calcicola]